MNEYRVTFRCRLLEDMHAGSGLGWLGLIDDCQARDVQGRPVVWSSTLAGLLRDVADELHELCRHLPDDDSLRQLATMDRLRRLFGAEGSDARSALVVRSLHFSRDKGSPEHALPPTHLVTSTARELHSRRPLDMTLRTVEVAAAGLVADGELRLVGDQHDVELITLCLQRLPSLGGGKSRGLGQVEISAVDAQPLSRSRPSDHSSQPSQASTDGACRLRLLLRNLEPLCLPKTGYPGNIIHSESYLPGQALRGAILTALTRLGVAESEVDAFALPANVSFGNGYFVPDSLVDKASADLRSLSVLPLPLTAEEAKATERPTDVAAGPWWCLPCKPSGQWLTDPYREHDKLQPEVRSQEKEEVNAGEAKSPKFKRIKSEDYLVGLGDDRPLERVRPKLEILMRNRTPVVRVERTHDSRRPTADSAQLKQEVGDLFAQTVLVEDQAFVADLCFASPDLASRFLAVAAPLLSGTPKDQPWLRLGRGGRPVRVERFAVLGGDPQPQLDNNATCFTLTLTSDLIARHDDLTFRTTLDGDAIAALARVPEAAGRLQVDSGASASDTRIVHGFNTAAGTRRAPALAIQRGSAFLVTSSSGDTTALKGVFDALATRMAKGRGLGERTEEGFGRFALNHRVHVTPSPAKDAQGESAAEKAAAPPDAQQQARLAREQAIELVLQAVKGIKLYEACSDKAFPSRGQWQRLRHDIEAGKPPDRLIAEIHQHAQTHSGRMWNFGKTKEHPSLIEQIDQWRGKLREPDQQRTFLSYLSRWVVARLDQLRRERKG